MERTHVAVGSAGAFLFDINDFIAAVIFRKSTTKSTTKSASRSTSRSVNSDHPRLLFLGLQRGGQIEIRGVDGHVGFYFVYGGGLRVGIVLRTLRQGEWIHDAVDRLIGAQPLDSFFLRSPDKLLNVPANLDKGIGIEVVVNDVAIFQGYLEAQGVVAIDHVVP